MYNVLSFGNYSRIYKLIFFAILVFYVYAFTIQIWENINFENGYTLGGWLINYHDGGFKRRGLSGSFFIVFYDILGINLKHIVFFFQSALNLAFVVYFYLLILKKHLFGSYFILLLAPCCFLFFFTEPGSIGRKEIILFATYSYYLYRLSNKENDIWKVFYPFLLILPIGILFYELLFFYLPFFLIPLITVEKGRFANRNISLVTLTFFILTGAVMGLLFIFGGEINQGASFDILESRGISNKMRSLGNMGILTWNNDFDKFHYFRFNKYGKYLLSLALGFIMFFGYNFLGNSKLKALEFLVAFLFTLLFSLPIYILAIDWGRWLNIQFVMMLLFITYSSHEVSYKVSHALWVRILYFIFGILLILFWRFQLVDIGFYISNIFSSTI